ncbi:MAG: RNA polymerase sigma factor [Anaerolineae bacterium]|nr:RNA polymerase sigma factor [Anaerolineae bacterium]
MEEVLNDDVLAKQARADPEAFAILYRRYLHQVYSYLLSRVGNIQDAQDLTAQTFLATLQGLHSYEPRGMFAAWLLSIARRKSMDHFRYTPPMTALDDRDIAIQPNQFVDVVVLERLQMQEVVTLLEKINPDRAEALRLRYFGGLSFREVAIAMEKTEGAVKMLVTRALEDLRNLLAVREEIS